MRAMSRAVVAFAVVSGACAAPAPTLTIGVTVQPNVVAFRPAGGDWAEADEVAHSLTSVTYSFPSTDGTLAVACSGADGVFQVEELAATESEFAGELYAAFQSWPQVDCPPAENGPLVQVFGEMLQGGTIYIGPVTTDGYSQWLYRAEVPQGVHDIVAIGQSQVLVRHDQPMFDTVPENTIDLGAYGSNLDFLPIETGSLGPPETVETELLTVNGTYVVLYDPSEDATIIPLTQLETGDVETVFAATEDVDGNTRELTVLVNGAEPETYDYNLPADDVAFAGSAIAATFDVSAAPFSTVRLAYSTGSGSLAITATPGWLAGHGSQLAFDATMPEFHWPLDVAAAQRALVVQTRASGVIQASATSGTPPDQNGGGGGRDRQE